MIAPVEYSSFEAIPSAGLQWSGASAAQLDFMKRVYDAGLDRSAERRPFIGDLPQSQLAQVEGPHVAEKEAALACKNLLESARDGIQQAAVNVTIGISSAYRSATWQFEHWPARFRKYYRETTQHRSTLPGGEHGEAAVHYLAAYAGRRFAIPGFSLHQKGSAIDFSNEENGTVFPASTSAENIRAWKQSWFWQWLENNARSFGFFQNTAIDEPWHWEFKATAVSSSAGKGSSTVEQYENNYFQGDNSIDPSPSRIAVSRRVLRTATDLARRGWIPGKVLAAIIAGERNQEKLTNMVFQHRHPDRISMVSLMQSSQTEYHRLRTEWNEIRLKIIEPLFGSEQDAGMQAEMSTGRIGQGDNPVQRIQQNNTENHDDAKGRMEWFYSTRLPRGENAAQAPPYYAIASAKTKQLANEERELVAMAELFDDETKPGGQGTNNWTHLGPSLIENGQATGTPAVGGRINSIAVSSNGARIYIGTANGGVWYSGDGGNIWEPWWGYDTTPQADIDSGNAADSLSVGAIAVIFGSSKTADEVYVGTGEPHGNLDAYFGVGIKHYKNGVLKLEDTDEKKKPEGMRNAADLLAGQGFYKIVIDPSDPSRVFAATTTGFFKRKSTGTWERVGTAAGTFINPKDRTTDFVISGTGASKKHYVAFQNDKVYAGNHDLSAWTPLSGTTPGQRLALATRSNASGSIYALDANNTLFKLDGNNFRAVAGRPQVFNDDGAGWYNIILGVDPDHDDVVYMAGNYVAVPGTYDLSLYRGSVTGTAPNFNFTGSALIGTKIHPDGHAIAFSKNTSGNLEVWIGCDGGLFYSNTPTVNSSFIPKNAGVSSVQLNYLAQRQDIDTVIFAGSQDNGTLRFWGDKVWHEDPQGDGGGVALDPNTSNPYYVIRQYIYASLKLSTNGGQSWSPVTLPLVSYINPSSGKAVNEGDDGETAFYGNIATFYPDAAGKTMIAFGTNRVLLSVDLGTTWVSLPNNNISDINPGIPIVAVKIASASVIYAITNVNKNTNTISNAVFKYMHLGWFGWQKTSIAISPGDLPAGSMITAIDIDNVSRGSFYISLGGAGIFKRCYYYDGARWHAAGPPVSMLNIPCHAIVIDRNLPNNIYLGSDVGVWKGVRGANAWTLTWSLYSQGLPESAITDLVIHQGARLLRAATHGRGAWEIAMDETTGKSVDIYLRANPADSARMQRSGDRFPWVKNAQDPTRIPTIFPHPVALNMSPDIKVRKATLGRFTGLLNYYAFGYLLGDIVSVPNWQVANRTGVNQVFIQVHNRGLDNIAGSEVRVVLLMADASSGVSPNLPAGFTAHINAGNANPAWLGTSGWKFADPAHPTKNLSGILNIRTPLIAQFDVQFTGFAASVNKVALLAFITTITTSNSKDQVSASNVNVEDLIMHDKHVSQRFVTLV